MNDLVAVSTLFILFALTRGFVSLCKRL